MKSPWFWSESFEALATRWYRPKHDITREAFAKVLGVTFYLCGDFVTCCNLCEALDVYFDIMFKVTYIN